MQVPAGACSNVPRDPGGGTGDPLHPDEPHPDNRRAESLRTLAGKQKQIFGLLAGCNMSNGDS